MEINSFKIMSFIEIRRRDEKVDTKFSSTFAGKLTSSKTEDSAYQQRPAQRGNDEYEEIKEDSLTRLKQGHASNKVPQDNSFESFPEITSRTADKLRSKGIENLFPI